MSKTHHGSPCWYELSTAPGKLNEAETFYGKVLGWAFKDAGMEGFSYHLASTGGDMVAGAMEMPEDVKDMPPFWMLYFAVTDADRAVAQMEGAGAKLHRPVMPIPGTGRFALLADLQGAAFGILEPEPMDSPGQGNAYNPRKVGHGAWNELNTSDNKAAMGFYGKAFGWTSGQSMPMGDLGSYDLMQWQGADIGAMCPLQPGGPKTPYWLPYFSVDGIDAAVDRIKAAGGTVLYGPVPVPDDTYIAQAKDPQGAMFAVVGPK